MEFLMFFAGSFVTLVAVVIGGSLATHSKKDK